VIIVQQPRGFAVEDAVGHEFHCFLKVDDGVVGGLAEELVCYFFIRDPVVHVHECSLKVGNLLSLAASA